MATISTTNLTGVMTGNSAGNTWSTFTSPVTDGVNAAQVEMMIDALRHQHLTIIKDQEERIVVLEDVVTNLRDTLDQYKDLLAAGIARAHDEEQRNREHKSRRDAELHSHQIAKQMLSPEQMQHLQMMERKLQEEEMRRKMVHEGHEYEWKQPSYEIGMPTLKSRQGGKNVRPNKPNSF